MVKPVNIHADIEDRLLNDDVIALLTETHGLTSYWVARHLKIKGFECDAVIHGIMKRKFRTIGVELKENDVVMVAQQALLRRPLFNYMYMVINWSCPFVLRCLYRNGLLTPLLREGVGIITFEDGKPFLVVKSTFHSRPDYKPNIPLTKFYHKSAGNNDT